MKSKLLTLLGLCLTFTSDSLYSQTYWIGDGSSTDWFDSYNWDGGYVPMGAGDVYINNNSTGPVIESGTYISSYLNVYNSSSTFGMTGGEVSFARFELTNYSVGSFTDSSYLNNNGYFNITSGSLLEILSGSRVISVYMDIYDGGSLRMYGSSLDVSVMSTSYSSVEFQSSYFDGNIWNIYTCDVSISDSTVTMWDSFSLNDNAAFSLYGTSSLHVVNTLTVASGSSIYTNLTSSIIVDDQMILDGGNLMVSAFGTFVNGETFTLFDVGTIVGTFDDIEIHGSTLADGLSWNTDNLYINGTITVIPEPSTYALIFGALALGLAIYRRRK